MEKYYSVAIDGPGGAGKSTLAKALAGRLGFVYVETGAIYRALGLAVQRAGLDSKDAPAVLTLLSQLSIRLQYTEDGQQRIILNGEDVTETIRSPDIGRLASDVSAIAEVRRFLLRMQRETAAEHHVVMDGRDIGTVVLPDADVKIFLTASQEERVRRRWVQFQSKGKDLTLEQVAAELSYRDSQDESRSSAPLKQAPDAVLVDTTGLTEIQSLDLLENLVREKLQSQA